MPFQPIGIALKDVAEAGLRAFELASGEQSNPNGAWRASGLSQCPRRMVLARAGFPEDKRQMMDAMTLRQGTVMHKEFEGWLQAYCADPQNDTEIVIQEERYFHKDLNITAKPDALIRAKDKFVLLDFKTERGGCSRCHFGSAKEWRLKEAKDNELGTAAKFDHRVQLTATAMVLESNGFTVDEARCWYFTKESWFQDEQPVAVHDPEMKAYVAETSRMLDDAWTAYSDDPNNLPHRLPEFKTNKYPCIAQEGSQLGRWCPMRSICGEEHMPA